MLSIFGMPSDDLPPSGKRGGHYLINRRKAEAT